MKNMENKVQITPPEIDNTDGRMPPNARDLEEAILGAMMLEKQAVIAVIDILKPEVFYVDKHRLIYKAIQILNELSEPIDILTVTAQLKSTGNLDDVGGAYYITQLTNRVASSANIEYHARIILQKYIQRELISESIINIRRAYDEECDIFELLDKSQTSLNDLIGGIIRTTEKGSAELFGAFIKHLEIMAKSDNAITGVPTTLTQFNKLTGGLQKSDLIIIAARPSMGKEQPLSAKILTPNGWTTMARINTGDDICGSDGKSYKVLKTFPQGVKEVYEICFDDGTKTRCGLEHLWEVSDRRNRKEIKTRNNKRVIPLKTIIQEGVIIGKNRKNFSVKIARPIEFKESKLPMHPYFLGIYLAEGNSYKNYVVISNPESEIGDKIMPIIPNGDNIKPFNNNTGWKITGGNTSKTLRNLKLCGLVSYEKFIPKKYLYSSIQHRLLLLQGILDGDGHVATPNFIEYITTSLMLRDDVIELVRGLGGRVNWIERMGRYKKNGKYKETRINYRVYISFDNSIFPVSTKKHLKRYKNKKKYHCKFIESVSKVGSEESKCILVNSPDNCYITDDYIVTHNTAAAKTIINGAIDQWQRPVLLHSLEMSAAQQISRLLSEDVHISSKAFSSKEFMDKTNFNALNSAVRRYFDKDGKDLLIIDDAAGLSINELKARAKRIHAEHNLCCIIVDYIGLVSADSPNKVYEIELVVGGLKQLAKELNIPVVALSQLNRDVEKRSPPRPMLSDLRSSGAIEQDADVVVFLYRPEYYGITELEDGSDSHKYAEWIVAKHRNGGLDTIKTKFTDYLTKFEDWEDSSSFNTANTPIYDANAGLKPNTDWDKSPF